VPMTHHVEVVAVLRPDRQESMTSGDPEGDPSTRPL